MKPEAPIVSDIRRHITSYLYREAFFAGEREIPSQWADDNEERLFFGVLGVDQRAFDDARAILQAISISDNSSRDIALFYLAMIYKDCGDLHNAAQLFLRAFEQGEGLPPALFEAALLLYRLRDRESSSFLFRHLLRQFGDQPKVRSFMNLQELGLYNEALAEISPRIERLLSPCVLLGGGLNGFGRSHSRQLSAIIEGIHEEVSAGLISEPSLKGLWPLFAVRPLRVMLVFPRHINCSEKYVENDILHHIERSAAGRGHSVSVFHADRILYGAEALPISNRIIDGRSFTPDPVRLPEELNRLAEAIDDFSPDIILFEANFIPTETTLDPSWFTSIKQRKNFALLAVVPDLYDSAPDFGAAWAGECDFVIAFNDRGHYATNLLAEKKLLYFPTVPVVSNPHAWRSREYDFVFVGSLTRGRDAVLSRVARDIPRSLVLASDRTIDSSPPSVDAYHKVLASGFCTFNTGYLTPRVQPIRTARVQEAIVSRTALIEESHREISRTLIPYLHFVPVDNAAQVVAWTRYLAENQEHYRMMVDAALQFTEDNYSPAHFWSMIEPSVCGLQ